MLVKLLKNERSNNCEACNKWDLLIQTVRLEKIRPSAMANTEKHINMTNERPRGIKNGNDKVEGICLLVLIDIFGVRLEI